LGLLVVRCSGCLSPAGEVTSMEAVDDLNASLGNAALGGTSSRAKGQDKIGVLVTDHGANVIWLVVGSRAG